MRPDRLGSRYKTRCNKCGHEEHRTKREEGGYGRCIQEGCNGWMVRYNELEERRLAQARAELAEVSNGVHHSCPEQHPHPRRG